MKATEVSRKHIKEIKGLYTAAFPKVERKPFWLIMYNHKINRMKILYLEDKNEFIGLAVMAFSGDKALLLYFAIAGRQRCKGYGSKALQLLMHKYRDKKFYLEIESTKKEADNYENHIRRKSFYLKNGMTETGLNVDLFGIEMEVLSNGASFDYDEYIEPYEKSFGKWIRRKIREIR